MRAERRGLERGNMKHRAPTEAGTRASRIDEWMHLLGEFERRGMEDVAIRATVMLMNCGPVSARRYMERQLRERDL